MAEKSYSQMRQEFFNFYQNEVKNRLPEYTKMRREEGPMQIAFFSTFCSFSLIFAFVMWYEWVSKFIFAIFPNLSFINQIVNILLGIDIFVCVISVVSLIILSWLTSNSSNTYGNTRYIKSGLEMALKKDLMPKFVNIFFDNGFWAKSSVYEANVSTSRDNFQHRMSLYDAYKKDKDNVKKYSISNLRDLKILNPYPWERHDDVIFGSYKGINMKINDTNTKILEFKEFVIIAFLFIWLSGITGGIFLFVFFIFILPWLLVILLIFSFKIAQYSLFRGVIVEFELNRKFKGHTVFHENSLLAKKIPMEKNFYKRVKLESPTFENKYNVYSNDQIEARYILSPTLIERIENLKFAFKAKYVRGSFRNNKLTLAIHTGKDMFAMGSDFKDSDSHTFENLYDEMISILQIVDELKLNENTGL